MTDAELEDRLQQAIEASELIVECLNSGEFDAARQHDMVRVSAIRVFSKCRNFDDMPCMVIEHMHKLAHLDTVITKLSTRLRDQVMTELFEEQANRHSHEQYVQNQNICL